VEGDSDERMFAELFEKYILEWSRRQEEQRQLGRRMHRDRLLGDRGAQEDCSC
jgi:hypothetical protein